MIFFCFKVDGEVMVVVYNECLMVDMEKLFVLVVKDLDFVGNDCVCIEFELVEGFLVEFCFCGFEMNNLIVVVMDINEVY